MANIENGVVLIMPPDDIIEVDKNKVNEIIEKYSKNLDWYNKYPTFWRTDVSDEADDLFEEITQHFEEKYKEYDVTYSCGYYPHNLPLSIPYEVFEKLSTAVNYKLQPHEFIIFKKFLETPPGQELEAWAWWEEYWKNRVKPEE